MSRNAEAMVEVTQWERTVIDEQDGMPPLAAIRFAHRFTGDIEAEGVLEYVMLERPDATTSFVGLERVTGRVAERAGSFVLEHVGFFERGQARVSWRVVPDSGTGELQGMRGTGGFETGHANRYPVTLAYDID